MKNFIQNGSRLTFAASAVVTANNYANPQSGGLAADGPQSGEAAVIGRIVGVVVSNSINGAAGPYNDSNTVIETVGVFNLALKSIYHPITPGETVYIHPTTGVVSDDYTGDAVPFGCALDAVTQYTTSTVRIKVFGQTPGSIGANS